MLNIENHLNLIRKIAWSYVRTHPELEFDDLFSEACLACVEYQNKYNPKRGCESSFIWQVVHGRLSNIIGEQKKVYPYDEIFLNGNRTSCSSTSCSSTSCSPEEQLIAEEEWIGILNTLSPKSKQVCSLVLNSTSPYLPTDKPKTCRGIIIKELRKQGWAWPEIWKSFREIKQVLSLQS